MAMAQATTALGDKEQAVLKRVSNRYLWFLMICLMINFVDRTNIGFAALTMNKDLGLTATTFGLAGTALSVAYLLFEIPSNLILERVGARKWLARIMITWGIASAATMFATGPWSLAGLRALVGIAEAGFAPGLVLYMTYWYPQYRRASAQTMFMLGQPLAGMLSATVGGFILGLNGAWGLHGWQWLFLIEGLPAIGFGIWMYFHLADKPKDAKFLSADEKSTLINLLERDEEARRRAQPITGPKNPLPAWCLAATCCCCPSPMPASSHRQRAGPLATADRARLLRRGHGDLADRPHRRDPAARARSSGWSIGRGVRTGRASASGIASSRCWSPPPAGRRREWRPRRSCNCAG